MRPMLQLLKTIGHVRPLHVEDFLGAHRVRPLPKVAFIGISKQVTSVCFQLASVLILSRLLSPSVFGLLAMATFFKGLMEVFSGAGFADAAVQKPNLQLGALNRVFWLNTGICLALSAGFIASGSLIANFYNSPELKPIFIPVALTFVLQYSFRTHDALLRRAMQVEISFIIVIVSQTLNLIVSVALALCGFGIWALVSGLLASAISYAGLLLYFVRWNPFKKQATHESEQMTQYGLRSTYAGIVNYLSEYSQYMALGKFASAASVGFYNRGQLLLLLPIQQVSQPVAQMILPALASLSQEKDKLFELLLKANGLVFLVTAPYAAFSFIFGESFMVSLLGVEWQAAGRVSQWLGLASIPILIACLLSQGNAAIGRPGRGVPVVLCSLPILLLGIFHDAPQGAVSVAKFYAFYRFALYPVSIGYHLLKSGFDWKLFIRNQSQLLAICCGNILILYLIHLCAQHFAAQFQLIWMAFALSATYFITWLSFRTFQEGRSILEWLYTSYGTKLKLPKSLFY